MYFAGFLLVLGPLITLHELGHYLVGRWFGVQAEAFSVGFGKEIWGRTDRHGTRWRLSALPLGGYVQFKGDMNPASVPDRDAPVESGSFQHAALWKRALIVAAGPVMNLLIAIGIFFAYNVAYGERQPVDPQEVGVIAGFTEDSRAAAAGFEVGDRIVALDGKTYANQQEIQAEIFAHPNREFRVTVMRGGQERNFTVVAAPNELEDGFGNPMNVGLIGVRFNEIEERFQPLGLGQSLTRAFVQCYEITDMMVTGIAQIVTGDRSIKELGGPIKIAKYSGERLSLGMTEFVFFAALISLNLAFINFLPIPALDGGHLAFYAAEAVRGNPVGAEATEWAYRGGIALVLMFMLIVTVNDVTSLANFGALFGS